MIEKAIEDGKCDMVFMARTFNCDPDYLEKIIEQRPEDITPCLRCDGCHSAICAGQSRVWPGNGLSQYV